MKLQIIQRFALHQIEVVCLFDDAALEATDEAFQVAIVDVEETFEIHLRLGSGRSCRANGQLDWNKTMWRRKKDSK